MRARWEISLVKAGVGWQSRDPEPIVAFAGLFAAVGSALKISGDLLHVDKTGAIAEVTIRLRLVPPLRALVSNSN
jgi:hypothetical protein